MTIDLATLEAAAKAATSGPWETDYRQRYVFAENGVNVCEIRGYGELIHMVPECEAVEQMRSNGTYIAAANPAVVLELIAELRQARAERDWVIGRALFARNLCSGRRSDCPALDNLVDCRCRDFWLKAAKEATCPRKD